MDTQDPSIHELPHPPPPLPVHAGINVSYAPTTVQQASVNGPVVRPQGPTQRRSSVDTFKIDKPRWNDIWAGILLILTFLGFVAATGLAVQGFLTMTSSDKKDTSEGREAMGALINVIVLFAVVLATALVMGYLHFILARLFTERFIWITGFLNLSVGVGTAIYYVVVGKVGAAVLAGIISLVYLGIFVFRRGDMDLTVTILHTVMDVAKVHGHVFLASFIGGLIVTVFGAWFAFTLVGIFLRFHPGADLTCERGAGDGDCVKTRADALTIFITFAAYWISEWIRQTLHTTIAGLYGSWYFCSQKPGGMPLGATRAAFKRAISYSFGSVSLGSLVVTIVQVIRELVTRPPSSHKTEMNPAPAVADGITCFCLDALDAQLQVFNQYAYSYIALYGKPFLSAAKDTWKMFKDRGLDVLVNDLLLGSTLSMAAICTGFECAVVAYVFIEHTEPLHKAFPRSTQTLMVYSFLIGLQIANAFMTPLRSGAATFFVAFAWSPEVLMRDHPQIWAEIVVVYPKVRDTLQT